MIVVFGQMVVTIQDNNYLLAQKLGSYTVELVTITMFCIIPKCITYCFFASRQKDAIGMQVAPLHHCNNSSFRRSHHHHHHLCHLPSIQKGSMPEWARQLPWCPHANVQWQFCWHQLSTERKEQDNTSFLIHVEFLLPLFSWLFNLFASFMWSSNQTPNDNAAVPTIALRSWLFFTWQQGSIKQHPCVVDMFWRTFSMVHVHAATANWG